VTHKTIRHIQEQMQTSYRLFDKIYVEQSCEELSP